MLNVDFDRSYRVLLLDELTFSTKIKYLAVYSGVKISMSWSVFRSKLCSSAMNSLLFFKRESIRDLNFCFASTIPSWCDLTKAFCSVVSLSQSHICWKSLQLFKNDSRLTRPHLAWAGLSSNEDLSSVYGVNCLLPSHRQTSWPDLRFPARMVSFLTSQNLLPHGQKDLCYWNFPRRGTWRNEEKLGQQFLWKDCWSVLSFTPRMSQIDSSNSIWCLLSAIARHLVPLGFVVLRRVHVCLKEIRRFSSYCW